MADTSARVFYGVTEEIGAAMNACSATVITEDGFLLRTCEHGIRHPVGYLHGGLTELDREHRHEQRIDGWPRRVPCDGCCAQF